MNRHPPSDWLCTKRRAIAVSPRTSRAIDSFAHALLRPGNDGRVARQSWVRYRVELTKLCAPPEEVRLEPISDTFVEKLRSGRETRTDNQIRTALRFWDGGLRDAYVWSVNGEPLCMQWLLHARHFTSLPDLGIWAGMFPPLPEGCGIIENIYSFPGARKHEPGAATKLAIAVLHEARRLGYRELRTHIAQSNLAAHRWARRIGLEPYGVVDRYSVKLPRLPVTYLCHHQTCEIHHIEPRHRSR